MVDPKPVFIHCVVHEDGDQYATAILTPDADKREKIILVNPYIIPVLFLPGIMGTNLRQRDSKKAAWRPPNLDGRGAFDTLAQLFNYLFKSTGQRAGELRTDRVEIDPTGPIDAGETGLPKNVLVARGWGALMRSSYHPFMAKLQVALNDLAAYDFERCVTDLRGWAEEAGFDAPGDWGAKEGPPLTREEIVHAAEYQFDVWAGGYNWLQSNRDSGAAIKDLIENTILPFYNEGEAVVAADTPDGKGNDACQIQRRGPRGLAAKKVIVVTHSMGGLVSRALTEVHQCDKVLGVSHGVMPATGAPASYKRMRAGFEGVEQLFLGRSAADVTAILSQAPGGLELLPTADYNDGKPWLFVRNAAGGAPLMALPQNGDPYGEIYQSAAWYGLVPDTNEAMLNPIANKAATKFDRPRGELSARAILTQTLLSVRDFHEDIRGLYKIPTYAHFGAQGARTAGKEAGGLLGTGLMASKDRNSWGEVSWVGDARDLETGSLKILHDDGNGTIRTTNGHTLTIAGPDCPGDGTVPVHSGEAPRKAGIEMCFAHGHGNPGMANEHFCYDHQGSYGDEYKRSFFATMYAIIKIAQQADWYR